MLACCRPPPQANDGNGDVQQRSGMENAAQITGASTLSARLAQVLWGWGGVCVCLRAWLCKRP